MGTLFFDKEIPWPFWVKSLCVLALCLLMGGIFSWVIGLFFATFSPDPSDPIAKDFSFGSGIFMGIGIWILMMFVALLEYLQIRRSK